MGRGKVVEFTDREKIENFDRIAALFYKGNFGQINKTDMELIMFDIYLHKLIDDNKNEDGTIDYRKCSDYLISQALGIPQTKVRNLKIKNHLVHPIEFNWKKSFAQLTENARYDAQTHKITIPIPDPNLYIELQNFIEEQGGYIEYTLNSKIFQTRVEYYIELMLAMEPEQKRKDAIKAIQKMAKDERKSEQQFDVNRIAKSLIAGCLDVASVIEALKSISSVGMVLANVIL